jgi:hypothetical protein
MAVSKLHVQLNEISSPVLMDGSGANTARFRTPQLVRENHRNRSFEQPGVYCGFRVSTKAKGEIVYLMRKL